MREEAQHEDRLVAYLAKELGYAIGDLGYLVGMGMEPNPETMKVAARKIIDIVRADARTDDSVIDELTALAVQYRDDLKRPPSGDSLERRIERINDVLAKLDDA